MNKIVANILIGVAVLYIFQVLFFLPSLLLHPPQTVRWVLSIASVIAGGIVIGWKAKKKGWLFSGEYALLLGIIYIMVNIIGFISFLLQPKFVTDSNIPLITPLSTMLKNIMNLPINIALAVFGGWIGEVLNQRYKVPHKK